MALIDCPECGAEASTEATSCPRCGFPIRKKGGRGLSGHPLIPYTVLDATRSIVGRLLVGGGMFATGIGFDAPPAILLALVVWGSTLPLYLRARRAYRLGPMADPTKLEEQVTRQLTEARDEARAELAGIDVNASRITELEERIDFMERLLARERERH
jgi:hypothetical protein